MYDLRYIENKNVDKPKWDALVSSSDHSLIFNNYDYLNAFCVWDALVLEDYAGAIPLPRIEKTGYLKLYQPPFIQKCNWIGTALTPELIAQIWNIIKSKFAHVHFNSNIIFGNISSPRINLILPISTLDKNQKEYSKSLRKNIIKVTSLNLITDQSQVKITAELYKNAYGDLNRQLNNEAYASLILLVNKKPEMFLNCIVLNHDKTVAALLFAKYNNRLHYILGAPNEQGRKLNALSFGINHVISMRQNQNYILDFEGSMIPSVKDYYKSFGSFDEPFYETNWCTPWLKLLLKTYKRLKRS